MKRLEKIRVDSFLLNKKELRELKGGADIYNTNDVGGCKCWYNNAPSVTYNDNKVGGCSCACG